MKINSLLFVNKNHADYLYMADLLKEAHVSTDLQVEWASSYKEALKLMAEKYYDIYLFDYELGRYNAIDLLEQTQVSRIRDDTSEPLPVIIIGEQEDNQIILKALQSGASDFIAKRCLSRERLYKVLYRAYEKYQLRRTLDLQRQSLERVNTELLHKNKEIQSFYYTLSHELKTPLTSAREFVSIMLDGLAGNINDTQQKYLNYVKESCDQLSYCINDLLDATRLDTGKLEIRRAPCELQEIIDHAILSRQTVAEEKQIKLVVTLPRHLPLVDVDIKRIRQVMINLLDNAIKFTPNGGKIIIKAGIDKEALMISVTDTGRGIPKEHQNYIFDRLYQVRIDDTSKEVGLGLGLNICRELIKLHGGKIWVDSTINQGSTFYFTLPLAQKPIETH